MPLLSHPSFYPCHNLYPSSSSPFHSLTILTGPTLSPIAKLLTVPEAAAQGVHLLTYKSGNLYQLNDPS